jgi:hypothetical protein
MDDKDIQDKLIELQDEVCNTSSNSQFEENFFFS